MTHAGVPDADPVFIVNSGRCGSTLLAEMMHENPDWLVLSEYMSYLSSNALSRDVLSGAHYWQLLSTQSPVLREMHLAGQKQSEVLYEQGQHGPWPLHEAPAIMLTTLPFLSSHPMALYEALEAAIRPRARRPMADHIRAVFHCLSKATGRRVWIERTGDSLLLTGKLRRMFPHARFVHLHRDGRDVACSMQRKPDFRAKVAYFGQMRALGLNPYAPHKAYGVARWHAWIENIGARFLDVRSFTDADVSLHQCARHWNWCIDAGLRELASLPLGQVMSLGYADLLKDATGQLAALGRFIDAGASNEDWITTAARLAAAPVEHWRALPAEDIKALNAACAPGLQKLGYL